MKKVKITIRKDGTQKVEAVDVVGESCVELTRSFEQRLGKVVGERVYKPEHEMTEQERELNQEYE